MGIFRSDDDERTERGQARAEACRRSRAAAAPAARHRGLPAHGGAALRRARQVDPLARGGDRPRPRAAAVRAARGERGRAQRRRHLRDRHARLDHPAAAPARRHRQGAGRGQVARADPPLRHARAVLLLRGRGVPGAGGAGRRGRGAGAHRPPGLRELRQAQQEDAPRDAQHRARDPRPGQARRHHRRAPLAQAGGAPGPARDRLAQQAAGRGLRAHAGRDRGLRGRAQDPRPRQEADGALAEGVLPQRADAGDPERARRARRVQERGRRARGPAQEEEDAQGGQVARPRRKSASSR